MNYMWLYPGLHCQICIPVCICSNRCMYWKSCTFEMANYFFVVYWLNRTKIHVTITALLYLNTIQCLSLENVIFYYSASTLVVNLMYLSPMTGQVMPWWHPCCQPNPLVLYLYISQAQFSSEMSLSRSLSLSTDPTASTNFLNLNNVLPYTFTNT